MSRKSKASRLAGSVAGVKGVQVLSYEFEKEGAYSEQELEPVRQQLREGSGWSRIVGVKEKKESTEIFVLNQGEKIGGCLILVAEPKELTVVHIFGERDPGANEGTGEFQYKVRSGGPPGTIGEVEARARTASGSGNGAIRAGHRFRNARGASVFMAAASAPGVPAETVNFSCHVS